MARFAAFVAVALAVLTGCTTASTPPPVSAPAAGMANVQITRSNSPMYLAAPATIEVNGERFADLAVGASHTGAIKPGPVVVTASAWSAPGQYTMRFNAEPGRSYRIAVNPRTEPIAAGAVLGLAGQAIEGGGPFRVEMVN